MTLPFELSLPTLIVAAVVLLAVLLFLLRRPHRSSAAAAREIDTIQAERDVLRAQHAVEVASLEAKIADLQSKSPSDLRTNIALRETEQKLAEASADNARLAEALAAKGGASAEPEVARLTAELATAKEAASAAERAQADALNAALAERDQAATEAERNAKALERLRQENTSVAAELTKASAATGKVEDYAKELAALREREEALRATLAEREARIAELQAGLSSRADGSAGEIARITEALQQAEQRERAANENLSKLAYEHDAVVAKLAAAERAEQEARVELEKRDTQLELRLQKIYELEAKQRETEAAMAELSARAQRAEGDVGRADASANAIAEARGAGASSQLLAELTELRQRLDGVRSENARLLDELAALRTREPAAEVAGVSQEEVAAIRASLRELAESFVQKAEADAASPAAAVREPTLAERIRAYKAARTDGAAG